MLAEPFVYYLDAGWKANFDCCLDTNPNSIWQRLSLSRRLPFLLMFLKYVTFPVGTGSLKELQHHGHQQETRWTSVTSIFPQAWAKILFWLRSAQVNLKSQPWGSAHGDSNWDFSQYLFIQASSKQDDYVQITVWTSSHAVIILPRKGKSSHEREAVGQGICHLILSEKEWVEPQLKTLLSFFIFFPWNSSAAACSPENMECLNLSLGDNIWFEISLSHTAISHGWIQDSYFY